MSKKGTTKQVNISAVTGQYVTGQYAQTHPATTVKLTVKKGK
ncbi:MAG TPA: hypothetical protein VGM30_03075 [Puia sp.]